VSFGTAFTELVGIEGKYSDDPRDPGNWTGGAENKGTLRGTMYGISAASYPKIDIKSITLDKAKDLYYSDFWQKLKCDLLPDPVAVALFKEGVNLGVEGASRALQRSLKVEVDGNIGQITAGVATSSPPKIVLEQFLTECAMEYIGMESFKVEGRGWISRVIQTAIEVQL
jgi:lysozyme family protein